MRTKILFVAMTAVALAITAFGIPLAVLVEHNVTASERSEIERLALRAAVQIGPDDMRSGTERLPHGSEAEPLAVYDDTGRRVEGSGPEALETVLHPALTGLISQSTTDGALAVAVPVSSGEHVVGVVRASSPM